jgi:hypothetical protein
VQRLPGCVTLDGRKHQVDPVEVQIRGIDDRQLGKLLRQVTLARPTHMAVGRRDRIEIGFAGASLAGRECNELEPWVMVE